MKILYVITKANFGGAQKYVYDLACAAKQAGHTPIVVHGAPGKLVSLLNDEGIRTIPLANLSRDLHLQGEVGAFFELLHILGKERPDVVHVNSSKGGLALLAARICGIQKILFTAHGWAFNEDRSPFQKTVLRMIYLLTILLSQKTICVSESVRKDIDSFLIRNKLVVIKNGITPPPFLTKDEARKTLRNTTLGIWVGMIAELHPTKRIADAIDAVADLRKEFPSISLAVLGEGEERESLEKQITSRNASAEIYLLGFKDTASKFLPAFDLFLMPSRTEALGYAAIEAGYAGLPVIASNVGGLTEVVTHEETGLLVPPEDPGKLADAIRTILTHPEHATRYGTALKAYVAKEFSKERMVKETFALYTP